MVLASLLLCTMFTVILILAAGSHMLSEDAADYLGVSFRVMVVILAFGGVIITVVIRRRLGLSILQESMV